MESFLVFVHTNETNHQVLSSDIFSYKEKKSSSLENSYNLNTESHCFFSKILPLRFSQKSMLRTKFFQNFCQKEFGYYQFLRILVLLVVVNNNETNFIFFIASSKCNLRVNFVGNFLEFFAKKNIVLVIFHRFNLVPQN